jgi:hypothetical protein
VLVGTNGVVRGHGSSASAIPVRSCGQRSMPGAAREVPGLVGAKEIGADKAMVGSSGADAWPADQRRGAGDAGRVDGVVERQ